MKLGHTFKHILAASALAAMLNSNSLQADVSPAAVELLTGTSSLGSPVLSPRSEDRSTLIYDGSSDATPVVVYPINVSATITAETNPTISTRRGVATYSTSFSTYRVTNKTLLDLIEGTNSSSRLVYVEAYNEGADMWLAYNIDGNHGLFVCSTSNLATGNLTAVSPEDVTINLAASYPLTRSKFESLTSNGSVVSDQLVGNIGIYFSADGYSASGIGSFTSTLAKNLRFSANLTNQEAYRLSGSSTSFSSLNNFTVEANPDFVNTQSYSINATNVTFDASDFFLTDASRTASIVYSLTNNGGLIGATINSTTGVITFNATTAGTYNPVVTATAYFNGSPTPVTGSTGLEPFATIELTVNPPVPVVNVVTPALGLNAGSSSPAGFITATNSPTGWTFVSGNPTPDGFRFNTANMSAPIIDSTGVVPGAYTTTIQASNISGNSTIQYLTITVNPSLE